MSLYETSIPQFIKLLQNIDKWFDKAESHAAARHFDPAVYLSARLAPDQFALAKQVQIACDSAKLGSARIAGKQAPSHADDETSLAELRTRIASTIAFLQTIGAADFEGAETRKINVPGGKLALARDHLIEHVVPTFYFHVTTTYAILRHNGVDLGKADFLGSRKTVEA
jgi:uncharacterized protein